MNEDWKQILYLIQNDADLYRTIHWLVQACVKKAKRGVTLDRDHLTDCSTMRQLCQLAVRTYVKRTGFKPYLSREDKRLIRQTLADEILDDVDYEMQNFQNEAYERARVARFLTEKIVRRILGTY
ncbi:MAG: hypothetical protein LUD72_00035 [Bacteroidales bacterium]|nr:hypothetical protein [Bacteroidales bacterium]